MTLGIIMANKVSEIKVRPGSRWPTVGQADAKSPECMVSFSI